MRLTMQLCFCIEAEVAVPPPGRPVPWASQATFHFPPCRVPSFPFWVFVRVILSAENSFPLTFDFFSSNFKSQVKHFPLSGKRALVSTILSLLWSSCIYTELQNALHHNSLFSCPPPLLGSILLKSKDHVRQKPTPEPSRGILHTVRA